MVEQQAYIKQLEAENRQLKAELREWSQGSLETNFTPKDIKVITELEHLEALGNNFPNGCLFRVLIDANIFEGGNTDEWAKHLHVLYISPSWEQISNISREVVMMDFSELIKIIPIENQKELYSIIYKSLIDCTLCNVETRYSYSDTETRWLQISTQPRREGRCVVCDGFLLDVTERKESEKKLLAEKQRLQDFGNNIPNGAYFQFIVNTQTGYMGMSQLSDTWTEITGMPVESALEDVSNLFATVHPNDLPHLMQSIQKSAQTLSELNCEVRVYENKTNKIRWIQVVSRPYREKELVIGDGIVFDITAHKTNEIELAIHRDELEMLVKIRTEEITRINEQLLSTNEELEAINEELEAIRDELTCKNNQLQEEILTRERIMHQLEYSETKMRNFIEQSVDGIIVFDENGRITEWNSMMEKITGMEKKDVMGQFDWELRWLFYPDEMRTQEKLEQLRQRRMSYMAGKGDQAPIVRDFSIHALDGENRHLRGSLFPIKIKETCHFGRIISDVTQKWKTEMELQNYRENLERMVEEKTHELTIAKEKAEESNRLKSSFLANMSHEVRTPLNAITGLLNILGDDPQISDTIREYIDLINRNSNQLLRLIDDILDAAKIEAGQMTIRNEPVCLDEMMNEMSIIFKQQLKILDKSLIILENITSEKTISNVSTDPVRLRQIMQNLLSNAIKFTDFGYIHFGYRLTKENMLEFFVEDTGIGIPQTQQKKIFLLFRQAETGNNRRYGGTGLGLTISRSLAQLMGGDMWITSAEGKGSTFTFTIAYHPCEQV